MAKLYCEHCYPQKPRHWQEKLDQTLGDFLVLPFYRMLTRVLSARLLNRGEKLFEVLVNKIMLILGVARMSKEVDRSRFSNRALVVWDEAQRRNLEVFNIQVFNKPTSRFVWRQNKRDYFYEENPAQVIAGRSGKVALCDDKYLFKKFLQSNQWPTPQGKVFVSGKKAVGYGLLLGMPLMVKPASASLSRHVFGPISDPAGLWLAVKEVGKVSSRILVEKYVPGDVYRGQLVNGKLVACAKRAVAVVEGDGQRTVEDLIDARNRQQNRFSMERKNATLHEVAKDEHLIAQLQKQQVYLHSVLAPGEKAWLSSKVNTASGADVIDVTDVVSAEVQKLLEDMSAGLGLPIVGMDFISQGVDLPMEDQGFNVIEANSLPYIDMHHFPSKGRAINVAGVIWDYVLGD